MTMKTNPALAADRIHAWANLIVGLDIPRAFVRRLGPRRRAALVEYVRFMWRRANDNPVRRVERPRWLPKRFIYGGR